MLRNVPLVTRIGLTPDELLLQTWSASRPPAYAVRLPDLAVLEGETLALVGSGTQQLLTRLLAMLPRCTALDGAAAARAGSLRIHAQMAVRAGVQSMAITEPFEGLDPGARALAVADLAGLAGLGLTVVVAVCDPVLGARLADRVVIVREGRAVVGYPVLAPSPRTEADVAPVTARLTARLVG